MAPYRLLGPLVLVASILVLTGAQPPQPAWTTPTFDEPIDIKIDLTCAVVTPAPNYINGTRCADGAAVNVLKADELAKMQSKWYHPHNIRKVETVNDTEVACGSNCVTGFCYYSMTQYDFVCGSKRDKDAVFSHAELDRISEVVNYKYRPLPNGRICFGDNFGAPHDPMELNAHDLVLSEWWANHVPNKTREDLEFELGKACRSKRCVFMKERKGFICASLEAGIESNRILNEAPMAFKDREDEEEHE